MAGYTRADTVNNIADGNVINASDLDSEFDTLQTAFGAVTGHTHDGSAANGAPITRVGPAQDVIVSSAAVLPKTNNTVDLGSDTYEFKDIYIDGVAYLDAIDLNGTAITSTAAELNILDGVTASTAEINLLDGVTASTAELNILDGVTSTAAELNILDGATLTVTELNYVDGVTSAIQTQLDGKQPLDAELTALAGLTSAANKLPYFTGSGTAAVTDLSAFGRTLIDDADAATARSTLGLVIGTNVQAYDQQLADVAGLTPTDNNFIVGNGTNFVTESGATARTSLGLGSIATQDASNVSITGGSIAGITDLAIADGGTGASTANAALNNLLPSQATNSGKYLKTDGTNTSWDDLNISTADITGTLPITNGGTGATTASGARTALGLVIGTDVQAYDAQLADVAGLTPTDNGVIIGNGTNFVLESGATLRTSLGLAIGTDVQAYDQQLADVAGLTPTDNAVIIGNGTNFVVESGSTLRTSLGLAIGTDVQAYDADTAKYDDATANFVGTLQNGGSNVVVDSDIGSTVQAYDSNLSSFVSTFTLPTTDGTAGQLLQTNGSGTLSFTTVNADPAGTAVALAIALG